MLVQIDLILIYLFIKHSIVDCVSKKEGGVCALANKDLYFDQVIF
jgi:hypothetical protein